MSSSDSAISLLLLGYTDEAASEIQVTALSVRRRILPSLMLMSLAYPPNKIVVTPFHYFPGYDGKITDDAGWSKG